MKRALLLAPVSLLAFAGDASRPVQAVLAKAVPAPDRSDIREAIQAILARPLTQDTAIRLAFLNNPRLRAAWADLDLAAADLREAGLLPNPVLGASAKHGPEGTKTEFSLGQEVVALFTRGLRRKVAARELDAARLQVAAAVLDLERAVRAAFIGFQSAEQEVAFREAVAEGTDASMELARRQRAAGNISQLTLDTQVAAGAQQRLDLTQARLHLRQAREALNRLLGLFGEGTAWKVEEPFPELPAEDPKLEGLEAYAVGHRFDVELARRNREVVEDALVLARRTRFFGSVTVGVGSERDPGAPRITGPFLDLELPLFNRGQARLDRLRAQGLRADAALTALAVEVRSEVREARDRLVAARATVAYHRDVLLPTRERVVAESQKHYNAMLLGVYDLVRAQQDRNEAARGYLEALRDYWVARLDLQAAVGGTFPEESTK